MKKLNLKVAVFDHVGSHWPLMKFPTGKSPVMTSLVGTLLGMPSVNIYSHSITMASYAPTTSKKNRSGVHCIAPGCTNHFYNKTTVQYHRLPSNKALLTEWLQVLKLKNVNNSCARVCSEHFVDSDYVRKGSFNSDGAFHSLKTTNLNKTAVPSIVDFSEYDHTLTDCPTPKNDKLAEARSERRERRGEKKVGFMCQMFTKLYRPNFVKCQMFWLSNVYKLI